MAKYALRALGGAFLYNDNSSGYMVLVSGSPVFVVAGTLQFDASVGRRAQASFTIHSDASTHFQQYQQVLIYDSNNYLVFSGYITNPKEQKPGAQYTLNHAITCCDQHYLADKRVVAASYANKTCGFIVQDILNNILSQEGVTRGQIYDGLTPSTTLYPSPTLYPGGNVGLVPQATFYYCTVAQALDELVKEASASGVPYYWMIDQFKQLWFVPYTTVVNSNTVDGTLIDQVNNPTTATRANPTYRNTQYVLGGVAQTVTQTEVRKGDSNTQSWTMGFDLASAPTITVNGVAQTVGLKGTTGSQFYWAQGDPVVVQDSGQTKLTSSDTLQVVYIGQYPNTAISQNAAQVAYQASIDGTSGIVEEAETDQTLVNASNALFEAGVLLTRYGQQGLQLQFTTRQSGFAPGQLITVNLPMHGLNNAQMLIETVSASDQTDNLNIWYTITAVVGPYDVGWVNFFSTLLAQQAPANSINVGTSQSTAILQQFTESVSVSMSMTVTVNACPIPNTTLFPATNLYPC